GRRSGARTSAEHEPADDTAHPVSRDERRDRTLLELAHRRAIRGSCAEPSCDLVRCLQGLRCRVDGTTCSLEPELEAPKHAPRGGVALRIVAREHFTEVRTDLRM